MSDMVDAPARASRVALMLDSGEAAHACMLAACDAPLDVLERELPASLGAVERARLERAAHPRRRASFLRGRAAARDALAGLCGGRFAPAAFEIVPGAFEQPVVRGPAPNVGVSLSHTDTLAVAAAFPESHPLGVDIERIDVANERVLAEYVAPSELAALRAADAHGIEALTLLWAAREALSKVLRGGLAIDFPALAVDRATRENGLLRIGFAAFAHLRAEALSAHGHVFALVLPAKSAAAWDVQAVRAWLGAAARH